MDLEGTQVWVKGPTQGQRQCLNSVSRGHSSHASMASTAGSLTGYHIACGLTTHTASQKTGLSSAHLPTSLPDPHSYLPAEALTLGPDLNISCLTHYSKGQVYLRGWEFVQQPRGTTVWGLTQNFSVSILLWKEAEKVALLQSTGPAPTVPEPTLGSVSSLKTRENSCTVACPTVKPAGQVSASVGAWQKPHPGALPPWWERILLSVLSVLQLLHTCAPQALGPITQPLSVLSGTWPP